MARQVAGGSFALAAVLALVALPSAAQAAPPDIRFIPVSSPWLQARMSPDGRTLAVFEHWAAFIDDAPPPADRMPIRLLDLETGETVGELAGSTDFATDVVFLPDGIHLASVHRNGDLLLWDVRRPDRPPLALDHIHYGGRTLASSTEGLFVGGSGSAVLVLYETRSGSPRRLLGPRFQTFAEVGEASERRALLLAGFAASPDGMTVATSAVNDEVTVWGSADDRLSQVREGGDQGQASVRRLAFTPDGSRLLYFDGSDARTHVWDVAAGVEIASVPYGAATFAISPDGERIAWSERVGPVGVLKVAPLAAGDEDAVEAFPIPVSVDGVTPVMFSPDGDRVVVAGGRREDEDNGIAVLTLP